MKFFSKFPIISLLSILIFAQTAVFAANSGGNSSETKEKSAVKESPVLENEEPETDPNEHEVDVIEDETVAEETSAEEKEEAEKEEEKPAMQVYGWKEWIWAVEPEHIFRAKLDSGARTCSIHATNVETYESDGEKWVKFTISDPRKPEGPRLRHKAPVLRIAKIKNDSGGINERIVVPLTFQIGDTKLEAEFNLNDRSDMTCPILLGRNVMKNIGYIDSSRVDVVGKPKAKKAAKSKSELLK